MQTFATFMAVLKIRGTLNRVEKGEQGGRQRKRRSNSAKDKQEHIKKRKKKKSTGSKNRSIHTGLRPRAALFHVVRVNHTLHVGGLRMQSLWQRFFLYGFLSCKWSTQMRGSIRSLQIFFLCVCVFQVRLKCRL